MAEEQAQSQERTEQPTAKRIRDARRRGQVARSRELTMTIVMIMGAVCAYVLGASIVDSAAALLQNGLSPDLALIQDANATVLVLGQSIFLALGILAPLFLILPIAAILGGSAIGGFSFSVESLQPKFSKLNPLSGLKRMFGTHGLVELIKAIAKAGVVAYMCDCCCAIADATTSFAWGRRYRCLIGCNRRYVRHDVSCLQCLARAHCARRRSFSVVESQEAVADDAQGSRR